MTQASQNPSSIDTSGRSLFPYLSDPGNMDVFSGLLTAVRDEASTALQRADISVQEAYAAEQAFLASEAMLAASRHGHTHLERSSSLHDFVKAAFDHRDHATMPKVLSTRRSFLRSFLPERGIPEAIVREATEELKKVLKGTEAGKLMRDDIIHTRTSRRQTMRGMATSAAIGGTVCAAVPVTYITVTGEPLITVNPLKHIPGVNTAAPYFSSFIFGAIDGAIISLIRTRIVDNSLERELLRGQLNDMFVATANYAASFAATSLQQTGARK